MNKIISMFRKFSSYILLIFTFFSFIFIEKETLSLVLVSISFLAFLKINLLELFKKERYLSKLELFFSILLFIRIFIDFDLNVFYKVLFYCLGFFFLMVYFLYFSNIKNINTNIFGFKRINRYKEESYNDNDLEETEEDFGLDEDEDFEEDDNSDNLEEDNEDYNEEDNEDDFLDNENDSDDLKDEEVLEKKNLKTKKVIQKSNNLKETKLNKRKVRK